MNKPVPWNIRGVGFDARETARVAAKRAGLSVGEWLNEIIAARAAELGVSAEDIEPDDRLEAIAARLSAADAFLPQVSGASRDADRLWAPAVPAGPAEEPVALSPPVQSLNPDRLSSLPPRHRADRDRARRDRAAAAAFAAADRVHEPAVADLGVGVKARFGWASDPVSAEARTGSKPAAVKAVQAADTEGYDAPDTRVNGRAAARLAPQPAAAPVDVQSLDQRLNAVLEKLNRSFEEAERFGEAAAASLGKVEDADASSPTPPPAPAPDLPSAPDVAFSDLHAAFKVLAQKLEVRTAERVPAENIELAHQVTALARQLDDLEPRPADPRVETIRHDVAALSARAAEVTPNTTLAPLEAAIDDLSGRVDLSRIDGVKPSVLAPVERLSRDMRKAIRAADHADPAVSLQRDMDALAAKVEMLRGASDPAAIDAMRSEIRDVRASLDATANHRALSDQLVEEVRKLGARLDATADRPTPATSRDIAKAVGDIRALFEQFSAGGLLGSIDRRISSLADRIDTISEQHAPADLSRIEARLGTLSAKVDAVGRTNQDMAALYGLVGELTNRVEEVRHAEGEGPLLNALQEQIGRLIERFDRSQAGQTSLGELERLVGDLYLQIEQSRNTAIDAAENAARTAAQDTLRAALNNPALNGGELTVQTGLDVDHVSQELAELRRIQEASERRVNSTLTALNTTLERLVNRMVADRAAGPAAGLPQAAGPVSAESQPAVPQKRRARSVEAAPESGALNGSVPFDPDAFLLEPGVGPTLKRSQGAVGTADLTAEAPIVAFDRRDTGDQAGSVSSLIAAARRAAQLAQASALEAAAKSDDAGTSAATAQPGKVKSFFARKRRPLLLSLAGLVLLLGTLQVARVSMDRSEESEAPADRTALPAAPAASDEAAPASPARSAAPPSAAAPASKDTSLLTPPADAKSAAAGFASAAELARAAPLAPTPAPVAPDPATPGQGVRDLAAAGNAAAQYEWGTRLSDGRGVARDTKEAAAWFERAAQAGLAPAQYRLGSIYEKGIGRATDPALAMAWYEKAANAGNARAMHNLAVMLAEGAGNKPDYGKAVTWFTKAASFGVRDSQFNLAVLLARGLGVPTNLSQSYTWFALASQQGDADAAKKRDAVGAKLDAKALADAKATVASFKALTPDPAANDVAPPPGGWDAAAPTTASNRRPESRVSGT